MNRKILATIPFILLASVAEAQNFGQNFGGHVGDYTFAYMLARFFGLFLVVIGLMAFIRNDQKDYFDQLVESKEFLFITGLITVMLGAIVVALNNTWKFEWRLLITILGWATFLKGAMMLIFPGLSVSIWKKLAVKPWVLLTSGSLSFIIGIYLVWIGFGLR